MDETQELTPEEQAIYDESQGVTPSTDAQVTPEEESSASQQVDSPDHHPSVSPAEEFEFKWNGKTVKADREKAIQWASQGYDYAQKVADLKRQQTEIEDLKKNYEEQFNPYKQIDEFAKTNPEWWNHVQQAWESREHQQSAQANPEFQTLRSELSELKQFKTQFEQEQEQLKMQQEDEQLAKELESVKTEYQNLDWDSLDEHGQSLEQRVLQHAVTNNIHNVRAAFRDYNHDNLLKSAVEKAKEDLGQKIQQRSKAGLLQGGAQVKGQTPVDEDVRGKSNNQLLQEAIAMYEQGSA